jgi:pyruvate carboxylase subunit B
LRAHPGGRLKYLVDVNGRRVTVDLGPNGIEVDGEPVSAHLEEVDGTPIVLLTLGGTLHRLAIQRGEGRGAYAIWSDSHRFQAEALDERRRVIRDMTGAAAASSGPAPLLAPMPGLIVRVNVQPGDVVQPGQPLVVMEAMKMENELRASSSGTVKSIAVQPGAAVEKGTVLVELVQLTRDS